jgi:hypothetical protein
MNGFYGGSINTDPETGRRTFKGHTHDLYNAKKEAAGDPALILAAVKKFNAVAANKPAWYLTGSQYVE